MENDTIHRSIEKLQSGRSMLWLAAIAFFGIGDVLTTGIGISIDGIREVGPFTSVLIEQYGILSMVATKVGVLCSSYALWRFVSRPPRIGIPLGLAGLGIVVVGWNLFVITQMV